MPAPKIIVMSITLLVVLVTGCSSPDSSDSLSNTGGGGLPAGAATVKDPEGDVRDAGGQSLPPGALSVDLLTATLALSAERLVLSLEQASEVPARVDDVKTGLPGWLTYTLYIADDEEGLLYMARVQLLGAGWHIDVYDAATEQSVALEDGPAVTGGSLACAFPRSLLPDLDGPFKWALGAEWSVPSAAQACGFVAFGDLAPGDGSAGYPGYPDQWVIYSD